MWIYQTLAPSALLLGDVVIIDSPLRLKEIHGKKGYISAHSYDKDIVTAYSITVQGKCWFVFPYEMKVTNEKIDPNINMTNDVITIEVDKDGKGHIK